MARTGTETGAGAAPMRCASYSGRSGCSGTAAPKSETPRGSHRLFKDYKAPDPGALDAFRRNSPVANIPFESDEFDF